MNAARDTVTVRVPGSTSNCGAGFDTLGLALKIYNRITLTLSAVGLREDGIVAEAATPGDRRALELVVETAEAFHRATDGAVARRDFRFHIAGEIPMASTLR